ncbi:hypothetical protein D9615_004798 [Tricholomella constricta]|uniref:DUF6534 domain-containing protein n=1 Tax=Tricholomella constricta TaxID=117010 RepID=A0A8H5M6V9_9AGAR|nr:hypothetical protein D9615_004798 [Tricholomella constricta]
MPSIQLLFGPMLIGSYMNTILYGVMAVQVDFFYCLYRRHILIKRQMIIYYQTYKKDANWMRYFMLFLFIVETLNTAFDIAFMYEPLVTKYGTPDATTFFPILLPTDPLLTVIISTPIQIFIAYRIKIISKATWLAIAICILAIISFGGGVWLTVTVIIIRRYSRKPELHWPALVWLLASAIADVTITVSLATNLARRKTGFSGTDDAINRIIRLTIQTGFVTAVFATLDVVCFLALPHTTINFVWDFALSKLYTNALLSTLNARSGWGTIANTTGGNNVLFGHNSPAPQLQTYSTANFRAPQIMSTGAYELEATSASVYKGRHDVEFGVSVRKEVNTVIDPPAEAYSSTQ